MNCIQLQADTAAARTIARLAYNDVAAVLRDSSLSSTDRAEALRKGRQQLMERLHQGGMLRFAVRFACCALPAVLRMLCFVR